MGDQVAPGGAPLAIVLAKDEESARRATPASREAYALGEAPAEEAPAVLGAVR